MSEVTVSDAEYGVIEALNRVTSGTANPEQWLIDVLGGRRSSTGVRVNTWSTLAIPTVWNSVKRIGGHVGMLPMTVKRRVGEGSEPADNHPGTRLLQRKPNHLQVPMTFRETLTLHALLEGNGRAWINRNALGQPIELVILKPEQTFGWMIEGEKYHSTWVPPEGYPPNASLAERYASIRRNEGWQITIPDRDVLHICGMSYDGLWGIPLIQLMKDTFGLEIAGRDSAGHSFRNNGRPGLLLEAPRTVFRTEKEANEFMDNFNKAHQGVDNQGRTALLREGMTAHVMPLSGADAQFLESREFSREDIALIFGTEAVMGDASSVYKGITEQNAAYIQNCLNPWFEKWEQECNRKLLSQTQFDADSHFFHIDASNMLRGDSQSLAAYTASLRTQGVISGNEARRMHGLNPVPELSDDYANPAIATPEEQEAEEEPQEEPEQQDNQAAARLMVSAQLRFEQRRIREGARVDGNFLNWCEQFYRKFQAKLEGKAAAIGWDTERAAEHCRKSQDMILDAAGHVTPDGLAKAIDELTANWTDRIEEF